MADEDDVKNRIENIKKEKGKSKDDIRDMLFHHVVDMLNEGYGAMYDVHVQALKFTDKDGKVHVLCLVDEEDVNGKGILPLSHGADVTRYNE